MANERGAHPQTAERLCAELSVRRIVEVSELTQVRLFEARGVLTDLGKARGDARRIEGILMAAISGWDASVRALAEAQTQAFRDAVLRGSRSNTLLAGYGAWRSPPPSAHTAVVHLIDELLSLPWYFAQREGWYRVEDGQPAHFCLPAWYLETPHAPQWDGKPPLGPLGEDWRERFFLRLADDYRERYGIIDYCGVGSDLQRERAAAVGWFEEHAVRLRGFVPALSEGGSLPVHGGGAACRG